MHGCECDVAADGQDALDYLAGAQQLPDYVLLDNWMPRRDGKQTLDAIRADPRYEGIIVYSISSTPPESHSGFATATFCAPNTTRTL